MMIIYAPSTRFDAPGRGWEKKKELSGTLFAYFLKHALGKLNTQTLLNLVYIFGVMLELRVIFDSLCYVFITEGKNCGKIALYWLKSV